MNTTFENIQHDLRKATVKEITDCMKLVNATLNTHSRLQISGKKEEVILRFTSYILSLLENNRTNTLINVIRIVNQTAPRKLCWGYENSKLLFNCQQVKPDKPMQSEELFFKPSPFFKPIQRLTSIKICSASSNTRQSKVFQFTLSEEHRNLLTKPNIADDRPPYQIRFYCSKYSNSYTDLAVEFPTVCELKVNDSVIQGNILRCLKGKPGTVNPPDISIMTRKQASNNVELVYINNDSAFIASIYLVERTTVSQLIQVMKKERIITKEEVLTKLQQTQEDNDVILESATLSTRDPLAFTRIVTPIRSKACQHLQCFDATTYLTMNEQTPTWSCPVCYRRIESWKDLIVDGYFSEMLSNTPKHIDSVRVEPNGHITIIDENPDLVDSDDDDDDEGTENPTKEVKIEEKEVPTILLDDDDEDAPLGEEDEEIMMLFEATSSANSQQNSNTTMVNSQSNNIPNNPIILEHNRTNLVRGSASIEQGEVQQQQPKKKQKSDVIDLTLDSDEEDNSGPVLPSSNDNLNNAIKSSSSINNGIMNNSSNGSVTSNSSGSIISSRSYGNGINNTMNNNNNVNGGETLILPHLGTLYNNTNNYNYNNPNNRSNQSYSPGTYSSHMNVYKYN